MKLSPQTATVFTPLDPDKAATSAVVLPVQADEVDQPVHQPESVELFSRIDCEDDPGE